MLSLLALIRFILLGIRKTICKRKKIKIKITLLLVLMWSRYSSDAHLLPINTIKIINSLNKKQPGTRTQRENNIFISKCLPLSLIHLLELIWLDARCEHKINSNANIHNDKMSPFFNGPKNRNRKREKKTSFVFIPSQKIWFMIIHSRNEKNLRKYLFQNICRMRVWRAFTKIRHTLNLK